ncbi:MAG: ATP-dependent DNA helicase RecG [Betaproteobacteria bacterium]|nr:ATP-dependent DNA helicase RecG [Betaproteobacteria bacterium]
MTQLAFIKAFNKPLLSSLERLGIRDLQGLLLHLPLRYIDETRVTPIRDVRTGESVQIEGMVVHAEVSYKPRKTLIARLEDAGAQITLRFLNFYPSQIATLSVGNRLRVYGEVRHGYFGYEMVHPACKKVGEVTTVAETLTAIYPTVSGVGQSLVRKAIRIALEQGDLEESLPEEFYQKLHLPRFEQSIRTLHHPPPEFDLQALENKTSVYWRRLAFDELLAQQLSMRKHYAKRRSVSAPKFTPSQQLVPALLKSLPFALTAAQQRVSLEIEQDLTQPHPMRRLLQGDVGSGKTIVACMAAMQSIESGWQVALMAPTEILAEQHYRKMLTWLSPLKVEIAWLTGSQSKKEREVTLANIRNGVAQLVVGTHALFQEAVQFKNLGLAIIDEQHRFGVHQRLALRQKGQLEPHQLMMSATPIPRTLSMSYYADLDVSVIDELPPGRTPIMTKLISDIRRDEILQRVREACVQGSQAYWVCPLVEESEALQLATAQDTFTLMQAAFPELSIGLVHGRMKPADKQAVMLAFGAGKLQLLVATTVIEVGVDVPNASLMVIEHAERMGLSQLHQLRGRVGRGAAQSTCILLYQNKLSETARARLKVIYESNDGFAIAQADLNIRGPGELLGIRQSGVPMLRIADLTRDVDLLEAAKSIAKGLLQQYPQAVERHLERWMNRADELVKV